MCRFCHFVYCNFASQIFSFVAGFRKEKFSVFKKKHTIVKIVGQKLGYFKEKL